MKKFLILLTTVYSCSSPTEKPLQNTANFEQANALYQDKQYYEAHRIYDSLSRLDSTNGELFFCKAKCEYVLKLDADCDKNFKYCISLGHKVANAYYNLGQLHLFKNDSLAAAYLMEYLKDNPDDKLAKTLAKDAEHRVKENRITR
ncbi:hypothetical protein [Flavisolibacter tropicus]|uniref:Tetratricopeptide repeat protein n=1 Tax=Flavisolibacter tropicus TaxID=1492898 RepID=A0A172TYY0_9BACT|nr:hypothetical protein [Flavisolibacter tropicus]ANE51947.1 hypothetical protein SY85_17060 [Flavisolibacter tropicus]